MQVYSFKYLSRLVTRYYKLSRVAAETPGTIIHFQEKWPEPLDKALHDSHPEQAPPIMDQMTRHIGSFLRGIRRGAR